MKKCPYTVSTFINMIQSAERRSSFVSTVGGIETKTLWWTWNEQGMSSMALSRGLRTQGLQVLQRLKYFLMMEFCQAFQSSSLVGDNKMSMKSAINLVLAYHVCQQKPKQIVIAVSMVRCVPR